MENTSFCLSASISFPSLLSLGNRTNSLNMHECEGGKCSLRGSETTASQGRAQLHQPVPLNHAIASALTRERSVDRDLLLSRNFPLSSDSSIHLTELRAELWAGFALARSPCEPQGTVGWEEQTRASQLGLERKAGRRASLAEPAGREGPAGRARPGGQGTQGSSHSAPWRLREALAPPHPPTSTPAQDELGLLAHPCPLKEWRVRAQSRARINRSGRRLLASCALQGSLVPPWPGP